MTQPTCTYKFYDGDQENMLSLNNSHSIVFNEDNTDNYNKLYTSLKYNKNILIIDANNDKRKFLLDFLPDVTPDGTPDGTIKFISIPHKIIDRFRETRSNFKNYTTITLTSSIHKSLYDAFTENKYMNKIILLLDKKKFFLKTITCQSGGKKRSIKRKKLRYNKKRYTRKY